MKLKSKRFFFLAFIFLGLSSDLRAETWLASPANSDWNNINNWDLSSWPNGPSASATFGNSSATAVTLQAAVTLGDLLFNGTNSFQISTNSNYFTFLGTGINNTSGLAQTILNDNAGNLFFKNNSQAVSVVLINRSSLTFYDTSASGTALIQNSGTLTFTDNASAAGATITTLNGGGVNFLGNASGGQAQFSLAAGCNFDILYSTAGSVTVGSIAGGGNINLGANNLTTGINGLSASLSGVISGTGSLTKSGLGLLILTGNNTYSGGTTITSGLIALNGGTLGTGPVNNQSTLIYALNSMAVSTVLNSGVLSFEDSASAGFADLINNNTLTFNSLASAYSSSITNTGTLTFNGNSTASQSLIQTSGLVNFNDASTAEASAISISGGALYFTGDSATTIASAGTAVIDDGNLVQFNDFSNASNSQITVRNNSALNFAGNSQGGTAWVALDPGATLSISAETAGSVTLGTVNAIAGSAVQLGANNLTLGAGNNTSLVYGTVTGTGSLSFVGTGGSILSGANTYSGGTSLLGGLLLVGTSNSLGTGSVFNQGGNLAPSSGGPMTVVVGGNYTQGAGGTLTLGLGGTVPGQWDSLAVTGPATLGGTLSITHYLAYVPNLGDSFEIMTASGVSGNFTAEINTITAYRFLPIYSSSQVSVVAVQPSFTALASTFNQKAVAAALDSIFLDPTQQSLMLSLGVQQISTLRPAYDQISPAGLTSLFEMGFNLAQARAGMTADCMNDIWTSIDARPQDWAAWQGPRFAANLGADQEKMMADGSTEHGRWGAFAQGLGNFGTVTGDGNGPGYQFSTGGVAAGMDYRISRDLVGGLLIGYNQSGTSQALDSVTESGGQVGLYGGWRSGSLRLQGLVDGGMNNYNTTRASYGGMATGTSRGLQMGVELGGEVDWNLDGMKLGPLATGQFTHVSISAFNESGSASPLVFPDQGQDQLMSALGLQMAKPIQLGGLTLEPSVKALWEHLFQGNLDQMTAGLTSSQGTFVVEGPALGTDGFQISSGLKAQLAKGLALQAQYEGLIGLTNYASQNFTGGISLDF